jgi:hypothetical protein
MLIIAGSIQIETEAKYMFLLAGKIMLGSKKLLVKLLFSKEE